VSRVGSVLLSREHGSGHGSLARGSAGSFAKLLETLSASKNFGISPLPSSQPSVLDENDHALTKENKEVPALSAA
jgi:hypothetical protein